MSNSTDKIIIVGAGAFGLSTALALARRGYKDVTVFDRCPVYTAQYSPSNGCDGASADINKVFRTHYGDRTMYEELAERALVTWKQWNSDLAATPAEDLPEGLSPNDELLVQCGFAHLAEGQTPGEDTKRFLQHLRAGGKRDRALVLNDPDDTERARVADLDSPQWNWASKMKRYASLRNGHIHGLVHRDDGFTRSDKACLWTLHLCKKAGVRFILGNKQGHFHRFLKETETGSVCGIVTRDLRHYKADIVIVASGGWTPSIVPATRGLLETTGGSLAFVRIPENRPDLRARFDPKVFCGWSLELDEDTANPGGSFRSMGGFPMTPDGVLKFGYRATKFTNYETLADGSRLSVPKTAYTEHQLRGIPKAALDTIKENIADIHPELKDIGITGTRMCWYTDSIDNHFLVDYVPGYNDTLFVASGGSGHGFKFLPVMGEDFVDVLEKKPNSLYTFWRWREAQLGRKANGLEEGEAGPRVLSKHPLTSRVDWSFDDESAHLQQVIHAVASL